MAEVQEADIADLDDLEGDAGDLESESSDDDEELQLEDMLRYSSVREVANLMRSTKLARHLEKLEGVSMEEGDAVRTLTAAEYDLVVESNALVAEIETEIRKVHKFVKDHYSLKFPELESLILQPIDYARVVKLLGNEMDSTNVDLTSVIPPHTVMVVNVTNSTTAGRRLEAEELGRVLEACDEMVELDEAKTTILEYVQSRMSAVAPNLSVLVGTAIAAQLIGAAGGLHKLSKLPAGIAQVLGKARRTLLGFSAATTVSHGGFLLSCDLVRREPDVRIRRRAVRLLACKVALVARTDATSTTKDDSFGVKLRAEIERKLLKWKEPPPAKQEKPLPAPDDRPRKRRGGKRARQAKERYKVTEVAKMANRIEFAGDGDLVSQTGQQTSMLGKMGSGLLRLRPETKVKSKKAKLAVEAAKASRSRETSGLASSLVFTPVQGLELPAAQARKLLSILSCLRIKIQTSLPERSNRSMKSRALCIPSLGRRSTAVIDWMISMRRPFASRPLLIVSRLRAHS